MGRKETLQKPIRPSLPEISVKISNIITVIFSYSIGQKENIFVSIF